MDIAVIGGGVAGLSAAWWLGHRHRVTLYERHARPGFVAHALSVPGPGNAPVQVDMPLRVFHEGYYPTLAAWYRELGVRTEPVSYASSFTDASGQCYFRWRNFCVGSRAWPFVGPHDLAGAQARRIVAGVLRFWRDAAAARRAGGLDGVTLGAWLAARPYPVGFVDRLLLPVMATVCTCPYAQVREFPAALVLDYLASGVASHAVRRAVGGADDVLARVRGRLAALHCNTPMAAIRRDATGVTVHTADGRAERHDHVVLATQANHALALMADATPAEAVALAGFRYLPIEVVMHTDEALMPPRRADWSAVNAQVAADDGQPMSTIWVNAVQPALRRAAPVFQTVHPLRRPRDDRVLGWARLERPVVDARSQQALAALARLQAEPDRRVWWCGSYAQDGIPLLESAVRSSRELAARLDAGVDAPAGRAQPAGARVALSSA